MNEKNRGNKVFAKGYCFEIIFVFFLIGCLLGTYYEEILWYVKYHVLTDRQGLLYGPFSPIYGIGVAIFVIFLGKNNDKRNIWKTLLYASIIGGVTEFATSWIADVVFGVKFWDYTGRFLNICGRTTVPYMIGWGIGGTVLMKIVYPFVSKWLQKIPYKIGHPVFIAVVIFITINMILTYTALGRMTLRQKNIPARTFIGEWMDKTYDDYYLHKKFPIMSPKDK